MAMATSHETASALSILRKLLPPRTLIHVGAGSGTGLVHQWHSWEVPCVWLIDAVPQRLSWAKNKGNSNWHTLTATLSDKSGECIFYQASNPDESGLVDPQILRAFWPVLSSKSSMVSHVERLDALLQEAGASLEAPWLIVDCLPALSILKGAGEWLIQSSVLWVRGVLEPLEQAGEGATLAAIEDWLQEFGFCCIDVIESNHPAFGHALFVRNWQQVLMSRLEVSEREIRDSVLAAKEKAELAVQAQIRIEELLRARDAQVDMANAKQRLVDELTQHLDRQSRLAAACQQKLEDAGKAQMALESERVSLLASKNELLESISALTLARDEHAKLVGAQLAQLSRTNEERSKLVAEREAQIEQLTQARSAQTKLAEERLSQVDQLTKLAAERQTQIEQLTQARNAQTKLAEERLRKVDELTKAVAEWERKFTAQAQDLNFQEAQQKALAEQVLALTSEKTNLDAEKKKLAADQKIQAEQLAKSNSEQARLTADLNQRIEVLSKEKLKLEQTGVINAAKLEDLQKQIIAWTQSREQQIHVVDGLRAQIERLTVTCNEQSNLVRDKDRQINVMNNEVATLKQAVSEQASRLVESQEEIAALTQSYEERVNDADDRRAQIERLTKLSDGQAKRILEYQGQITTLTRMLEESKSLVGALQKDKEGQHKQISDLQVQMQKTKALANEAGAKISGMEASLADRAVRQQILNEEITRAEAQLDLIKEIVLREPGL